MESDDMFTADKLPYEILSLIFLHAVENVSPRSRTRILCAVSASCRSWYHPATKALFSKPAVPARCVWLLLRSLRRKPNRLPLVTELHIYGFTTPEQIVDLLSACEELQTVKLRTAQTFTAFSSDWSGVMTVLESRRSLQNLDWSGADGIVIPRLESESAAGMSLVFSWPTLKRLTIQNEYFRITEPYLAPLHSPTIKQAKVVPHNCEDLTHLRIASSRVPYSFFDRLQPRLRALTHLNLQSIHGLTSLDLDRAFLYLGERLVSLTLLDSTIARPEQRLVISSRSLSLLPRLSYLTLGGSSSPLDLFEILPSHIRYLSLEPGDQLDPEWVLYGLTNELRSKGLEELSVRLRDLGEDWHQEKLRRWVETKPDLEQARNLDGRKIRIRFVDRR